MSIDIESIILDKKEHSNERIKIKKILNNLLKKKYDNRKEFRYFLGKYKRKFKFNKKNSIIIDYIKQSIKNKELIETKKIKEIILFLRTKIGKSLSGIVSVTVFTSPFPTFSDSKTGKKKFNVSLVNGTVTIVQIILNNQEVIYQMNPGVLELLD